MPTTETSTSGRVRHIRPLPSDSTTTSVPVSATAKFAPDTATLARRNFSRRCSASSVLWQTWRKPPVATAMGRFPWYSRMTSTTGRSWRLTVGSGWRVIGYLLLRGVRTTGSGATGGGPRPAAA